MNWKITVVVAKDEGSQHDSAEHNIHAASQLSAAQALLAKGIDQTIASTDELLILVVPEMETEGDDAVEFFTDMPRPARAAQPDTEAYRTYALMLSHIWQSKRTDAVGIHSAKQNAAWAENDQRKLDQLAAAGKGLTAAEKELADRLHAEHNASHAGEPGHQPPPAGRPPR